MPTADRRGMTTSAAARINEFGAEATPGEAPVAQVKQFIDAGLRSGPNVMRWTCRPAEAPSRNRNAALWPDQHFEGFAVVHRLVAVWDRVESDFAVEDLSGFDGAVEDVREQGFDVGAGGCGSAGEGDVGPEEAAEADRPPRRIAGRRRG
jgi:hypothetical protein